MRKRALIIPSLTLLASLAAIELAARVLELDQLQREAIAVAAGANQGESWQDESSREAWLAAVERMGVDYLPDEFRLEDDGFHSRWGFCAFDFDGLTVLAMGDSTTRQTMIRLNGVDYGDQPEDTWPVLLGDELGPGVQVCVVAENGFHPRDLAMILDALQPRFEPAAVLALLCENDFDELPPRVRVEHGDAFVFYQAVPRRKVLAPLYHEWLYPRSEAYRFMHWRLSLLFPAWAAEVRIELDDALGVADAFRRMDDQPGELAMFYLPILEPQAATQDPRAAALARRAGVSIRPVNLPKPAVPFRRTDDDAVHLNQAGHQHVVDAMLPVVRGMLGQEP